MLKISPIFSDGAVLCRRKELRIFGGAEDGARVRCELRDAKDVLLARGEGTARREEEEGRTAGQGPVQVQTACGGVGRGAGRSGVRRV